MPDNSGGVLISMDQNDNNNLVLPGFRFHPTEEELVDFYLRRMVEGKRLAIDLIAMVDLYRHDPWELPAMAIIGEKEWFFFAPREQKYPNGARPNRVTTSGYWKATGTDRMVRSSQGCRCIGLKKTLVFYTGRAPRGIRTNWIMNEYRLPQQENTDNPLKNQVALCRVYRKASSEGFHDSACENAALRRTTKENHRRASPSRLSREDEGNHSSNGSPSSNSIHEPLFQDLTSDKPGIGNVHSLKHQTEIVTQQAQNAQVGGFHPWQIEQNSQTSPSPIQLGFFHSNLGQASFLPEQESNMLPALQSNINNSEGEGIRNSAYLRNSILGSYTNSAGYTPHAMEAVGSNLYYLKLLFPEMEDQNRSFNSLPGSDDSNQTACVPPSWIRHSSSRPNKLHGHDQLPSQYEFLDTSNILHPQHNIDKFWDSNVWSSSTGGGGSFQSSMCPSQR